jgi:hypothetical protein
VGCTYLLVISSIIITISVSLGISDIRGPESQVVAEELHDDGGVLVGILRKLVKLSDGIIEGLLGELAGFVGGVEDLVVENGEVEGETEADGVGGGQVSTGNITGLLVSLEGVVSSLLSLISGLELSNISVVVALEEENVSNQRPHDNTFTLTIQNMAVEPRLFLHCTGQQNNQNRRWRDLLIWSVVW